MSFFFFFSGRQTQVELEVQVKGKHPDVVTRPDKHGKGSNSSVYNVGRLQCPGTSLPDVVTCINLSFVTSCMMQK